MGVHFLNELIALKWQNIAILLNYNAIMEKATRYCNVKAHPENT